MRKTILLSVLLSVFASTAVSQNEEGVRLYNLGEYDKAVDALKKDLQKDESNAGLWNIYGLALDKRSKSKDAAKAFERAVELEPTNSDYRANLSFVYLRLQKWNEAEMAAAKALQLDGTNSNAFLSRGAARFQLQKFTGAFEDADKAIEYNPGSKSGYLLKSEIYMGRFASEWGEIKSVATLELLNESIGTLERCITFCGDETGEVKDKIDVQNLYYHHYGKTLRKSDANPTVLEPLSDESPEDIDQLKLSKKPAPKYTQQARINNTGGSIRMAVMFKADGTIGPILVLQGLSDGLTESAINAARGIKFEPEKYKGEPRSTVKTIVYNFSVF